MQKNKKGNAISDDDRIIPGKPAGNYKQAKRVKCIDCEYCAVNDEQPFIQFGDDFYKCHCELNSHNSFWALRKLICKKFKEKIPRS